MNIDNLMAFDSLLNILKTIFICVVLVIAIIFFNKDVKNYALKPIERMIEKINDFATDPVMAWQKIKENSTKSQNSINKVSKNKKKSKNKE